MAFPYSIILDGSAVHVFLRGPCRPCNFNDMSSSVHIHQTWLDFKLPSLSYCHLNMSDVDVLAEGPAVLSPPHPENSRGSEPAIISQECRVRHRSEARTREILVIHTI